MSSYQILLPTCPLCIILLSELSFSPVSLLSVLCPRSTIFILPLQHCHLMSLPPWLRLLPPRSTPLSLSCLLSISSKLVISLFLYHHRRPLVNEGSCLIYGLMSWISHHDSGPVCLLPPPCFSPDSLNLPVPSGSHISKLLVPPMGVDGD